MARRKTKIQSGLSVEKAREIVIRVKKMEGLSKHTIENYNKLFNDLERCFAKNKYMENFSISDARRFLEWQLTEKQQFQGVRWGREKKIGVSVSSANSYLRLAKGAFSTLINEGHLEENPFMEIKNIKFQKKQVETLTEEEIQKILKSLDHSWFADFRSAVLIHVLLDSFGRIGEVLALKKQDIDFQNGSITFNETKNSLFRIVPVTKKTLNLLEKLIEECDDWESEYIFLTHAGNKLGTDAARKHIHEIARRAGINRRIHPHIFRHTSSMMFLKNGGSIRILQKILGHADIKTTLIYSHVLDDTIKEQHEKFSPIRHLNDGRKQKTRTSQTEFKR
ncbi:tyrosine-type recombinase/integrase [Domibacillus indicus]|uniref:tyrosine-type recombinase/integrase n=1 Tax=Domibacillus indicus TaxID=1437523 RepID=UPI0020400C4C|nr:tyrosine-type recombinase/integrase [Domibacillus indicus]MCM3788158.1 tyrosine-type recombinase/integrase [Domibacillus indicus]